jgi:UDP-glucose 4-epimerase
VDTQGQVGIVVDQHPRQALGPQVRLEDEDRMGQAAGGRGYAGEDVEEEPGRGVARVEEVARGVRGRDEVEGDLGDVRAERAPVGGLGLGSVAPVEGMKVLVTGAAGFLGRVLVLRLVASGAVVIAVDDVSAGTSLEFPETRTGAVLPVLGDVRDAALLGDVVGRFRPEVVVHLAAVHFIPECERDPRRALDVNVCGTQAVIDACAKGPPRALFFASTADVYAHSVSVPAEDDALDPIGVYGVSKLTGERLLRDQAGRLADCRVLVGRLFNLYGPGDPHPHLVPEVVRQLVAGSGLSLGVLDGSRDFVYVDDAAWAVARLLACGARGTFNIGTGIGTPVRDVVAQLCRLAGVSPVVTSVSERRRAWDRFTSSADPARLRGAVGPWPCTSLRTGLSRTLAAAGAVAASALSEDAWV